jgi:hypothetical protein
MIMGSFDRIATEIAHDHGTPVPSGEVVRRVEDLDLVSGVAAEQVAVLMVGR